MLDEYRGRFGRVEGRPSTDADDEFATGLPSGPHGGAHGVQHRFPVHGEVDMLQAGAAQRGEQGFGSIRVPAGDDKDASSGFPGDGSSLG